MESTATTIIWAAPADACLLEALGGEASPSAAGARAAVAACVGKPQSVPDHALTRVSQQELATLWSAGACRDADGLPLLGEDGKLVCAFGHDFVDRAHAGIKARQTRWRREEGQRKRKEAEEKQKATREKARTPLAKLAPKMPGMPARKPVSLIEADQRRQASAAKAAARELKAFKRLVSAAEKADAARSQAASPVAEHIPLPARWRDAHPEVHGEEPPSPARWGDAHPEVHGEEPPSPAQLPHAETDQERVEFAKLQAPRLG
jgi:uncharacterized Zn finger protein (UPF0148 family)